MVAPSSPFTESFLSRGVAFLESHGFRVCQLPGIGDRKHAFLAGDDHRRANELMRMFLDPDVDALFAVRGGYGAQRILDLLDPEAIAAHPKIFLGYSDASLLIHFLVDRCGIVCFHGPLATEMGSVTPRTERFLLRALCDPEPMGPYPLDDPMWIRPGVAQGRLIGGNLSVLCATLGTPWEVRTGGRILFLEDCGEKPYRIDRMLVQMKQAGKLSGVAGIVFGDMISRRGEACPPGEREAIFEVLQDHTRGLGVPVLCGLPAGHGPENLTLPMGVRAVIGQGGDAFSLQEGALSPQESAG